MTPNVFPTKYPRCPGLYQHLIDTCQDLVWGVDAAGCCTFVNLAVYETLGYTAQEMIGRSLIEFEADTASPNLWQRIAAAGDYGCFVATLRHRDGTAIDLRFTAIARLDEAGERLGVVGTARRAQHQMEAALHQSESRFQKLAANAPGVIYQFQLKPDGIYCFPYVSAYSQQLWEVEAEMVLADAELPMRQIVPEDLESFQTAMERSTSTLEDFDWVGRIQNPSGKIKWIHAHSRPELQVDGSILWDGLVMDISDRKMAEEVVRRQALDLQAALNELQYTQSQLIHAEKMSSLGQLVAGVAHEINNPINFVYGNLCHTETYLEDLLRLVQAYQHHYPHPPEPIQALMDIIDLQFLKEDAAHMLHSMVEGTERISKIVLSLRTFARLDEAEIKPVDLHEGLDGTLMILHSRLERLKIKLTKQYSQLPLVECNAADINQVLMNLLMNAIDAVEASASPEIVITTSLLPQQRIRVSIADNGYGIAAEDLARVFDPFYTTKPVGQGTGLGLSMSYQIITHQHHGSLYCHSVVNQGTEFVVEIPLAIARAGI
jgi:PAS domain S-box-containing protein